MRLTADKIEENNAGSKVLTVAAELFLRVGDVYSFLPYPERYEFISLEPEPTFKITDRQK